jgi:hypothetical protein
VASVGGGARIVTDTDCGGIAKMDTLGCPKTEEVQIDSLGWVLLLIK